MSLINMTHKLLFISHESFSFASTSLNPIKNMLEERALELQDMIQLMLWQLMLLLQLSLILICLTPQAQLSLQGTFSQSFNMLHSELCAWGIKFEKKEICDPIFKHKEGCE